LNYRIGIDFDNTIASYDALFIAALAELNWHDRAALYSKKEIRDQLRLTENGETKWQELQALVYGPRMNEAHVFPGLDIFLSKGRVLAADIFIVSHKTQYAARDVGRIDLRQASLKWLKDKGLLGVGAGTFKRDEIFFEATRDEKIDRIINLECTHFIDDLVEVFEHPKFPPNVEKILFDPYKSSLDIEDVTNLSSWADILYYMLGDNIA